MALHWGVGDVKDWATVTQLPVREDEPDGEKVMNPVTERLIFATMVVGLSSITEQNADEFFVRLWIWDHVHGAMFWGPAPEHKPRYVTRAEVKAHVGLWTNASRASKSLFYKELEARVRRDMLRGD